MNIKSLILLVIITVYTVKLYSYNLDTDSKIVNKIYNVLLEEYDKYKDKTWIEKIILKMGRSAYIDSVTIWKNNYNKLDSMQIKLHPRLEYMAEIADKNIKKDIALYFRSLLEELTLLGFKNLQIYYLSTKEYLTESNLSYEKIDINLIDDALCNIKYYEEKKALYERENVIKSNILEIMQEGKLKYKLAFYSFAFKFFNKIRVKVIERDMERMLAKINEKK